MKKEIVIYSLAGLLGLFLFLSSFNITQAVAPSLINATSTVTITADASTWTVTNHTGPNGGNNTCIWASVSNGGSNANPDSVKWNGVDLVLQTDFTAVNTSGKTTWYLATSTTVTANGVVTWAIGRQGHALFFNLQDCIQSGTIVDATAQNNSAATTSLEKDITTVAAETLIITEVSVDQLGTGNYTSYAGQLRTVWLDSSNGFDFVSDREGRTTAGTERAGISWTGSAAADLFVWSINTIPAAAPPAKQEDIFLFD